MVNPGTVTGNSISFDTASTFSFSSSILFPQYIIPIYKVVAGFRMVKTMTMEQQFLLVLLDSLFLVETVFNSSATAYNSGVMTNQKVVIAYAHMEQQS